MSMEVRQITGPLVLGEGPHWDEEAEVLYFVSINERTIHKYDPITGDQTKTTLDGRPGFIVPVEGAVDQFVVGLEREFVVVEWDGGDDSPAKVVRKLGEVDQDSPKNRINDGKADPRGRIFGGTMGYEGTPGDFAKEQGSLYRIDGGGITRVSEKIGISNGLAWDLEAKAMYYIDSLERNIRRYDYDVETGEIWTMGYEGTPGDFAKEQGSLYRIDGGGITRVSEKIGISNGLAWDLEAKAMYYIDSLERNIRRYDYDVETGEISNMSHIFDLQKNGLDGFPDGCTIDTAGNLWVAVFGAGCVAQVSPAGALLRRVPLPAKQVTSCTFGGPNLNILYVTSSRYMNKAGEGDPQDGCTFMITGLGVKGHTNVNFKF